MSTNTASLYEKDSGANWKGFSGPKIGKSEHQKKKKNDICNGVKYTKEAKIQEFILILEKSHWSPSQDVKKPTQPENWWITGKNQGNSTQTSQHTQSPRS